MARGAKRKYSDDTVKEWIALREQGAMNIEIAAMYQVPASTVRSTLSHYREKHPEWFTLPKNEPGFPKKNVQYKVEQPVCTVVKEPEPQAVKEKTLDDFTPREIIQYLYGLGYRIDEQGLYCLEIRKNRVKLADII